MMKTTSLALLWKLRLQPLRSMGRLLRKSGVEFGMRIALFWGLLWVGIGPATATGLVAGATEFTQIANMVQLADSYAQDALRYQNEIMRYEIMAKNMIDNPLGVSGPNLGLLLRNQERIMAMGQDIGSSVSRVDENFARQFQNPQAGEFGVKFKVWTNTSLDGLKAAMENNGLHRENFKNDNEALEALSAKVQASEGNLAAAKTLGEVNVAQLGESIKLRDLLSQQQQAVNTYYASQVSKDQERQTQMDTLASPYTKPIPVVESRKRTDWNSVLLNK